MEPCFIHAELRNNVTDEHLQLVNVYMNPGHHSAGIRREIMFNLQMMIETAQQLNECILVCGDFNQSLVLLRKFAVSQG